MRNFGRTGGSHEPADTGFAFNVTTPVHVDAAAEVIDLAAHGTTRERTLPASLTFPAGSFKEIEFWYEPAGRAVWCLTRQAGIPSFTASLMDELNRLHARIAEFANPAVSGTNAGPLFYVGGSANNGVFNLGGDLPFFVECIRNQDADALRKYAYECIKLVHEMDYSLNGRVYTICLLEGDALGGGFEAAISFNFLAAERGVKMGLPETLFNAFPGMGAYSHMCRRLGPVKARELILSGKVFDAAELYEMGVIDLLVEKGEGREAIRKFLLANERRQPMLLSMEKVRRRVDPVSLEELLEIADIWVENSLNLTKSDLRRMEILTNAQARRIGLR